MTTYTHKKSLRHITDEQFSEKTTVDGSRIDKALQESVDHVNSIPPGDVLSRYTESKFVFGYRPNRDYASCVVSDTTLPNTQTHYYAHHFPWMQIANNPELTLGEAEDAQNPRVVKTVRLADSEWGVTNSGSIPFDDPAGAADWEGEWNLWAAAGTAQGVKDYTTLHGPANGYQYAYTNSWNFNKPAVIDDLMIAFTVDSKKMLGSLIANTYSTFAETVVLGVVLMVDNHFSQELREDSEIEVAANRYNLSGFRYTTKTFASGQVDMLPAIPAAAGVDPVAMNLSIVLRWRDLNIPLHENARVRLSIVHPWQKFGSNPNGMTWGTVATAPFFYASPRGCMTVLEELES